MRSAVYHRYGGPDVLSIQQTDRPEPRPGAILVRVVAASVNAWDWDKLSGNIFGRLNSPFRPSHRVLGADIAGVVEATGAGVTRFRPGDEVFGDLSDSGWGGFAEFAVGMEKHFVVKPGGLSFEEAACLPQAGLLALQGLSAVRSISPGEAVLVNGAGGGMGSFAIQLAKRAGAVVTAVDAGSKIPFMLELGADHAIDYQQQDFAADVGRYDLVLDTVASRNVGTHLAVLKPGGSYVVVGGKPGVILQTVLQGSRLGRREGKKVALMVWRPVADQMAELAAMVEAGELRPAIDRVLPLAQVAEALRLVGTGAAKGKVLVAP